MRSILVFLLLLSVRAATRLFFRLHEDWIPTKPAEMADRTRVVAILNHTSLYEPLIAGYASTALLWRFARHGVLPVAEKTMRRPIGMFFRFLVRHAVTVTRHRDATWEKVLTSIDDRALVVILPEGRMKRRTGLDSSGRPMTVRTGIADILEALPDGRMLTVYSGGLHHIQSPGELMPRLFQPILCRFEMIDIARYKREVVEARPELGFSAAVVADLTERRDRLCPTDLQPPPVPEED
ncbi:MAG: 1-acyl-sn-glycerol-3-phosphate acyltransferase [Thermoanaerobaculales bacterium]|jgi:1-acyl-sn-glycerol-3-phosphate acyltransferase|nr:1-acyl-sn-glycerol-3-phosphate acyltransferase [Thermoanaerobaculales bacterium]